ncbi:translation initiation factor IF-2-like [Vulpes lagopus]|uniref:translation initiation factor IF-2-like n=1 Tax=Vulpes lagopus TaxID=494514 RepID=UPI001BCA38E8|nr:translation initiation factor IF-2-like [Vulpes lagopus]
MGVPGARRREEGGRRGASPASGPREAGAGLLTRGAGGGAERGTPAPRASPRAPARRAGCAAARAGDSVRRGPNRPGPGTRFPPGDGAGRSGGARTASGGELRLGRDCYGHAGGRIRPKRDPPPPLHPPAPPCAPLRPLRLPAAPSPGRGSPAPCTAHLATPRAADRDSRARRGRGRGQGSARVRATRCHAVPRPSPASRRPPAGLSRPGCPPRSRGPREGLSASARAPRRPQQPLPGSPRPPRPGGAPGAIAAGSPGSRTRDRARGAPAAPGHLTLLSRRGGDSALRGTGWGRPRGPALQSQSRGRGHRVRAGVPAPGGGGRTGRRASSPFSGASDPPGKFPGAAGPGGEGTGGSARAWRALGPRGPDPAPERRARLPPPSPGRNSAAGRPVGRHPLPPEETLIPSIQL